MDIHVQQIDTEVAPLDMSDFMYTVGSGSIIEGVDELILGLKAGEDLKLNGSVGAGVVATYELKLKQVKERVLPELSDEWVEENTEWKSVGEMRDAILAQMRKMKIVEAQMSQRDAVLVSLSELVSDDVVPETLADSETNERLHDLGQRLSEQNVPAGHQSDSGPAARDAATRRGARGADRSGHARARQGGKSRPDSR